MAKDNKKAKHSDEPNVSPRDKDIHLNVVGVPKKNVDIKKTYSRQNNEDYQLYRISIDTKGNEREKERKHRLGSLEPAPKKTRHRPKSNDNYLVSSDDSSTHISHPRTRAGRKEKPTSPKSRRKECVDSEICFTIPGEKGKAIRIVGSSTKPLGDSSSRDNSVQRSKRKRTESPKQVEFAKVDAVFGTDQDETSSESQDSLPYRQTSPQVYKVENNSPNEAFKDPKVGNIQGRSTKRVDDGKAGKSTSKPNLLSSRTSSPPENSSHQRKSHQPENREPRGPHTSEYDKPSTSGGAVDDEPKSSPSKQTGQSRFHPIDNKIDQVSSISPNTNPLNSDHEPTSAHSTSESKGKYPYYPYDQQKRSKSPSKQFQEPREDKESYTFAKLPSIPEVRSNTEHDTSPLISGPQRVGQTTREPTVPTESIARPKEAKQNASPVPKHNNHVATTESSSKPLRKQDEPVLNNEHRVLSNPLKDKNPTNPHGSFLKIYNESISPYPTKVETHSSKLSNLTPSNTQRDNTENKPVVADLSRSSQIKKPPLTSIQRRSLGENPMSYGTPTFNQKKIQPQMVNQSNSPMIPRIQRNKDIPVVSYNVQDNPKPQLDYPDTYKHDLANKSQGLMPSIRSRNSPPLESSVSKLRSTENTQDPVFKKTQIAGTKKMPTVINRPVTADKEVNTEKNLKPREKIMLEINEELSKKSSPFLQKSIQGSVKPNVSSDEKDTKRKSKLSAFVSSIPKPSFKRKSSLEKKSTDKNVAANKTPNLDESPNVTKGKVNVKDEARKPVNESEIVKQAHEPVVEAYPAWVTSPNQQNQQPEDKRRDVRSKSVQDGQLNAINSPNRTISPDQARPEDRRDDVQPQSVKDSPLIGSKSSKGYPAKVTSTNEHQDQQSLEKRRDIPQQIVKDGPLSGRNSPKGSSKNYVPYGMDDSPSVEIANRSYGENSLAKKTSTHPLVSERMNRSGVPDEEEGHPDNVQGQHERTKNMGSDTWKPEYSNKRQYLQDSYSNGSNQDHLEREKEPYYDNYGKNKMPYAGPNFVAYPGQINEQTPFGYDPQFSKDPKADLEAIASLEKDFDDYKRSKKDKHDSPTQLVDRNPSLTSRASRTPEEGKKYGHPIQVVKGSADSQSFAESRTTRELNNDSNKNVPSKNLVYDHGKRADNKSQVSKGSLSRSSRTPTSLDGSEVKIKHVDESPYGNPPEVQAFPANLSDTTYSEFQPEDSTHERSPDQGKSKSNSTGKPGPRGILIFVNKKNDTANPFNKNKNRPSPKAEDYLVRPKNERGPKKGNKTMSSSSEDTSTSTIVPGSSYGGGDKNSVVERTSSGRRITQRFPCGCIRITTSARGNKLKQEELISAFCKEGSQCEVSRAQRPMLGRSMDSSSMSWNPESSSRPSGVFPDIEVIADGVVSRKPIKSRPPAPTMNGAKLTGSFKLKSNKVNGVCNLYLDRKLKKYLRNNMDKIKLLLEDENSR